MEAADSLVEAEGVAGVAGFSDSVLGGCAVRATCPAAGGAFVSAGTDMAGGKLGRQFANVLIFHFDSEIYTIPL